MPNPHKRARREALREGRGHNDATYTAVIAAPAQVLSIPYAPGTRKLTGVCERLFDGFLMDLREAGSDLCDGKVAIGELFIPGYKPSLAVIFAFLDWYCATAVGSGAGGDTVHWESIKQRWAGLQRSLKLRSGFEYSDDDLRKISGHISRTCVPRYELKTDRPHRPAIEERIYRLLAEGLLNPNFICMGGVLKRQYMLLWMSLMWASPLRSCALTSAAPDVRRDLRYRDISILVLPPNEGDKFNRVYLRVDSKDQKTDATEGSSHPYPHDPNAIWSDPLAQFVIRAKLTGHLPETFSLRATRDPSFIPTGMASRVIMCTGGDDPVFAATVVTSDLLAARTETEDVGIFTDAVRHTLRSLSRFLNLSDDVLPHVFRYSGAARSKLRGK